MKIFSFRFVTYSCFVSFYLNLCWRVTECTSTSSPFSTSSPSSTSSPRLTAVTTTAVTTTVVTTTVVTTQSTTTIKQPDNVKEVEVVDQTEDSVTIQFETVDDITEYKWYYGYNGEKNITVNISSNVNDTLEGLNAAETYNMTLHSVLDGLESSGCQFNATTAPSEAKGFNATAQNETSITLQWKKQNDTINYIIRFSKNEEKYVTAQELSDPAQYTVTDLQNTTLYNFTLFTVFKDIRGVGAILRAATAPLAATGFKSSTQTETSITLEWDKVDSIQGYVLVYHKYNNEEERVPVFSETHEVTNLQSGTLYNFTLYTEFENVLSRGVSTPAATVPLTVSSVIVTNRTLNTITLQWETPRSDWKYLFDINGSNDTFTPDGTSFSHEVKSLSPGTVYQFNITTEFGGLMSNKYENETATVIDHSNVLWNVTESTIRGEVEGAFTEARVYNDSQLISEGTITDSTVSFTDLYPGATYTIELMYKDLEQYREKCTTYPPSLNAWCKDWAGGYSVYVEWDKPRGIVDSVELTFSNGKYTEAKYDAHYVEIPNFQPAQTYKASITSISGSRKSSNAFTCRTDARGVIAGAFFGVLLFLILVCVVAFIILKRPNNKSTHKKSQIGGYRASVKKSIIPVAKFPSHFYELSADENRGFSEEYEDLDLVGKEQTQKAAVSPENKPKNRFVNVLPYDQSRVKLTSSASHDDYINANYMPGYNSDREFIAAQGPMPSTVNDFWRMVWEQNVRGIVMVTNCTEGGRTKCEQYWPTDSNPRVCGDLAIFQTFVEKESSWTLREFKVKHRCTSEERTVKHFHFTAWPDHGVPLGTDVLILFRTLVRQHIQTEAAGTPTVVHCSAGVGRTGTIIALDVLLQQLEKEKAVDIYGFVHKMRLNRPHMVQTESQYVFLHQCIMDSLQTCEENFYENDLIYANATALREFQNNMKNT